MRLRAQEPRLASLEEKGERLQRERDPAREALRQIAEGSWNFGNARPGLTVMQFARDALAEGSEPPA